MIEAEFFYNKNGDIYGFEITHHSSGIVCAAVSALAINAVNAFKTFGGLPCDLDFNPGGGHIRLEAAAVKSGAVSGVSRVLFDALKMGVAGISGEYPRDIKVYETHVR